jgi:F0F1-type ATP synthase delta subunit
MLHLTQVMSSMQQHKKSLQNFIFPQKKNSRLIDEAMTKAVKFSTKIFLEWIILNDEFLNLENVYDGFRDIKNVPHTLNKFESQIFKRFR